MPVHDTRFRRWIALILLLAVVMSPGAAQAQAGNARNLDAEGVQFFIDPDSYARAQADEWQESRPDDAEAILKIADHAQADWFGDWTADPAAEVGDRVTQVMAAGALRVMVLYNIPNRDCGLYSAGGADEAVAYQTWIAGVAEGIGDRAAVVILEPDAIAGADCLTEAQADERYAMLKGAVTTLGALAATDVYIDAGNVDWHPAAEVARRLELVGVGQAAGFALNVSNFFTTDDSVAYGQAISDALTVEGGIHFIVDTSRNGNGTWETDDPEAWCNPPDRALGEPPTVETADPLVDAYLWIKSPGESDGECRGAPAAGEWFPEYALELAKNAHWQD